jgi:hypothetical protein
MSCSGGDVVARGTVPGKVVDGVQVVPGPTLVVTTWQQPGLWWVDPDGGTRAYLPGFELPATADFCVDRQPFLVLLPHVPNNELGAVRVPIY